MGIKCFLSTDLGKTVQAYSTENIEFSSAQWHGSLQFAKQKTFHHKETILTLHMLGIPYIVQTYTSLSFLLSGKKKKSKKQNPRPNKKIWPKSSSHVYNEEDHPLQSEHEHMLLWLHDSSPAGLISVPLPSQLPSQAWPGHRTSPKKKS